MLCQLLLTMALVVVDRDAGADGSGPDTVAAPAPATPDRWLLMQTLQGSWYGSLLDGNRTQIYGWTEASGTTGFRNSIAWPSLSESPSNRVQLNQNYIIIEQPVITSGVTMPTYGFRSDTILPGGDSVFTHARGYLDGQTGRYQVDPYQLYAEAYFPTLGRGLDFKIGRVAAPYGQEVTGAAYNALFSHAYAYFYNPYTHTGIMPTFKLSDNWALGTWFTLGNDVGFSSSAKGMFVGVLQYVSSDQRNTAVLSTAISNGRYDEVHSFSNQDHIDLVLSHRFTPRLCYTLDAGTGFERDVPNIGIANWSWAVNYLTWNLNPRLDTTMRLEFFDDRQGFKTGFPGLYRAFTWGWAWKPYRCLIIRPELRYDYNAQSRPFGDQHGQFTSAVDLILRW